MEEINIHLGPKEYLGDKLVLSKKPGLYFIHAPTGAGKSFFQVREAGRNGLVIFPVKSVCNQQRSKALKENVFTNIVQIEKLTQEMIDKATSIHFDEAQLWYEGGFRYDDTERRVDVGILVQMLIEASKRIPVYMYSASEKRKLFHVPFTQYIHVYKEFKRSLNVVYINKDTGTKAKTSIQTFVDIIRMAHKEYGCKILVFIDSEKTLAIIKKELALSSYEIDGVTVQVEPLKSVVITSKTPETNKVYKHIMEEEKIGGIKPDVVLTTSTMEAGININDRVLIISEQVDADRLFQRFGRARNEGEYILISGNGSESLSVQHAYGIEDEFERALAKRCKFHDKEHAQVCDDYSLYASRASQMKYAMQIIKDLSEKGYSPDFELNVDYARTKSIHGSKSQLLDYMKETGKNISEISAKELAVSMQCTETHAQHHIDTYNKFRLILQCSDLIKAPVDYIYSTLSSASIDMVASLSEYRFRDKRERLENMIAEIKEYIPKETDKASLDDASDKFFDIALSVSDPTPYRKLFRVLLGYVPENNRLVMKTDEERKEWWKVKGLSRAERKKLSARTETVKTTGKDMVDYHEFTQWNQEQVINASLKEFKSSVSKFKDYDTSNIQF